VCKYCHQTKSIDLGGSGLFDVTSATTSAVTHLKQKVRGHGYNKDGSRTYMLPGGQRSVREIFATSTKLN
jgi:hypothetical protein